MTPKSGIRIAVTLLAVAGIGSWAWQTFAPQPETQPPPPVASIDQEHQVVVTYFTSDKRCTTCKTIEKQTNDTVHNEFHDALIDGSLKFQTINFDRPENQHFIDQYQLAFKTVVISSYDNGAESKWKKFDKVWELVDTPVEFTGYLKQGITDALTANPDA